MKKEEYTKQEILKAMLKLLKNKPLDDITITELVNTANVGRASFYRNYKQKEDVLIEHLYELFIEWGKEFEALGDLDVNGSLLRHFWKEKDFYLTIHHAHLGIYIYEAMKEIMKVDQKENPIEKYLVSWYAGSIYGFIDEWMNNEMKESPEEMAQLTTLLLSK